MPQIGPKTITVSLEMIDRLVHLHALAIDQAYLESEGALTVAINLKYSPNDEGRGIDITTGINFIKERVKDTLKGSFDENMDGLFDHDVMEQQS